MPVPIIDDTGELAPSISDFIYQTYYIDSYSFILYPPVGYIEVYLIDPIIELLPTQSPEDLYNMYEVSYFERMGSPPYPYTINIRRSCKFVIVSYEIAGLIPTSITVKDLVIHRSQTRAIIEPDPNEQYTEPTMFTVTPPTGYAALCILNNAYYFKSIPEYGSEVNQNLLLYDPFDIYLYKNTKLEIYYYNNNGNGTLDTLADEFNVQIDYFNFSITNYAKCASFSISCIAIVEFTTPCNATITILDLELKHEVSSNITIDSSLSISLEFSSTSVVTIVANNLTKKYILKREVNKSIYSIVNNRPTVLDSDFFGAINVI